MKTFILIIATNSFLLLKCPAQVDDICNGVSRDSAKVCYVMLQDDYKNKNYLSAEPSLFYLLKNMPEIKTLYIKGEKIYKELIAIAKTEEEKSIYQKRLDHLLELKGKYFY